MRSQRCLPRVRSSDHARRRTGATLAFDAVGGGKLASQILTAMEAAANHGATGYSGYGSTVYKQVYLYGALDPTPTVLSRGFGMSWGVGAWLLSRFLLLLLRHRPAVRKMCGPLIPRGSMHSLAALKVGEGGVALSTWIVDIGKLVGIPVPN